MWSISNWLIPRSDLFWSDPFFKVIVFHHVFLSATHLKVKQLSIVKKWPIFLKVTSLRSYLNFNVIIIEVSHLLIYLVTALNVKNFSFVTTTPHMLAKGISSRSDLFSKLSISKWLIFSEWLISKWLFWSDLFTKWLFWRDLFSKWPIFLSVIRLILRSLF